jgi:hypothetical protein
MEKPAKGASLKKTISRLSGIFKRSKDEASEDESVEVVEGLDRPPGHETTKVESFEPEDGEQNSNQLKESRLNQTFLNGRLNE